jgi:hypothetical protein
MQNEMLMMICRMIGEIVVSMIFPAASSLLCWEELDEFVYEYSIFVRWMSGAMAGVGKIAHKQCCV